MTSSEGEQTDAAKDCTACPVASRREFLRDAAIALAGIAASLSIARTASALPAHFDVRSVNAMRHVGNDHTYAIPATDGVEIDRDTEVILVRWQGAVYAFNLACPHQHTALRWDDADRRFQCPRHHSQYQPDGEFITGRATRAMDRFSIRREGDKIVVDVDAMHKQDEDPTGWNAAVVKLA
ncbi:MAG TPA: Rieske (2Fe-2S) protein [Gemmatimonadaceae bacterium]